jgi:hypothetical protein
MPWQRPTARQRLPSRKTPALIEALGAQAREPVPAYADAHLQIQPGFNPLAMQFSEKLKLTPISLAARTLAFKYQGQRDAYEGQR